MPTTQPHLDNVLAPAGAVKVDDWAHIFSRETMHRFFYGTERRTDSASVSLNGFQNEDGSVRERWIYVAIDPNADDMSAAHARQLARALIAAADEYDEAEGQR